MSIEKFLNEIYEEPVMEGITLNEKTIDEKYNVNGSFNGSPVKYSFSYTTKEEILKNKAVFSKAIKVMENYFKSNYDNFINTLLQMYPEWHDGETTTKTLIESKLKVISIDVHYYKEEVHFSIWRKNYYDFFGNHSVNTSIKVKDNKVVSAILVLLEG